MYLISISPSFGISKNGVQKLPFRRCSPFLEKFMTSKNKERLWIMMMRSALSLLSDDGCPS